MVAILSRGRWVNSGILQQTKYHNWYQQLDIYDKRSIRVDDNNNGTSDNQVQRLVLTTGHQQQLRYQECHHWLTSGNQVPALVANTETSAAKQVSGLIFNNGAFISTTGLFQQVDLFYEFPAYGFGWWTWMRFQKTADRVNRSSSCGVTMAASLFGARWKFPNRTDGPLTMPLHVYMLKWFHRTWDSAN